MKNVQQKGNTNMPLSSKIALKQIASCFIHANHLKNKVNKYVYETF